jgi:hypothetical protein
VWDAWLKVKSNGGAAGADGVTIEQFAEDLSGNPYRLWNRMSSGSYHPGPVRAVEIPKKGKQGGVRVLGIPNVVDRIAMVAAASALEPGVEPVFHEDSYGYRPGRSPVDAVGVCRERCWRSNWVVDLDIRAFLRLRSMEPHAEGGRAHRPEMDRALRGALAEGPDAEARWNPGPEGQGHAARVEMSSCSFRPK